MRGFFCALMFLTAPLGALAQTSIDLDRIETIKLDEQGLALIRVNPPRTGILRADVFSAHEEAGSIYVEFEAEAESDGDTRLAAIPVGSKVVEKGRQILRVRSDGAVAGDIQLRLLLDPALDFYEPNNSLAKAVPVDAPFLGLVRVSAGDEDWFRVSAPRGHLIGVHLRTRSAYVGPVISFHDRNGEVLYATNNDEWGHRGMRYYRSEGQPIYVKVVDTYDWRLDDARAFRQLAIETFEPNRESANVFVKIDMGAVEGASNQIDFVGEAAGTRVASADEATEIAEELTRAVSASGRSGSGMLGWIGLAFVLFFGAAVFYTVSKRRQKKHQK